MCRPQMIITLMMQFLDKNALSSSVNFGLLADLGLHGNEYNWASGSIFYAAYLVAQPLVARLQILPIGKYLSFSVIAVGSFTPLPEANINTRIVGRRSHVHSSMPQFCFIDGLPFYFGSS